MNRSLSPFFFALLLTTSWAPDLRAQEAQPTGATAREGEAFELDEVVVLTPGRREQGRADTVTPTEVFTREEMVENGAENVADALQDVPGIEVVGGVQGTTLRVQGLDPQHTLILIDGEPVIGRVAGAVDLSRLQIQDVDRIEVVRGGSSALYGSAAHGGVINIITRRSDAPFSADARVALGLSDPYRPREGTYDLGLGVGFRHGELTGRADFGLHQVGPYDLDPSTLASDGSERREYAGGARLEYRAGDVRVGGRVRNLRRDLFGVDLGPGGAVFDRRNRIDELGTQATVDAELERGVLAAQLYYTRYRDQFVYDQRGGVQEDRDEQTTQRLGELSLQYTYTNDLMTHALTVGLDAQYEALSGVRISRTGRRTRVSPYAQYRWDVAEAPRLSVIAGVRADLDSQFGAFASPKLALRVDPVPELVLRASAGRGFRAPNFKELYLDFENPSAGYRVVGNPDVQPEVSWSLQFEAAWTPTRSVTLRASLYRNQIDELINTDTVPTETGSGQLFTYVNVASAVTQGSELTLRVRPHRSLDAQLGYVFLYARDLGANRRLAGRPRHRGTFRIRASAPNAGFSAVVRGAFVGRRPFYVSGAGDEGEVEVERIDDGRYLSLTVRLEQRAGEHVSVFVGGDNLAGAGSPYLTVRPRTFYVGARARY